MLLCAARFVRCGAGAAVEVEVCKSVKGTMASLLQATTSVLFKPALRHFN